MSRVSPSQRKRTAGCSQTGFAIGRERRVSLRGPRREPPDTRVRVGETLLRHPPRPNRFDERAPNGDDGLVEEVMTEAERVGTGGDRPHSTLLHAHAGADRLHLERVRHDHPGEAELLSQHVVEKLAAHRRGLVTDRPDDDVRGHDRLSSRLDRRAERDECRLVELSDERKCEVRVDGGVAVSGEVLCARRHPRALKAAHEGGDMPRDELCVGAERADSDHGVLRIRVDVGDGREVEVDARICKLRTERRCHALGEPDVVDDSERAVTRIRAPGRRLEPRHVAALFVDCNHEVGTLGAQIVRQRTQLVTALDVPRIQNHAAEPLRESSPEPVGHCRPLEPREDAARGEPLELRAHALTAPAVRPKAIFRCTRRKKITTGIAVRVEAAMSPPQSVFRLVP